LQWELKNEVSILDLKIL